MMVHRSYTGVEALLVEITCDSEANCCYQGVNAQISSSFESVRIGPFPPQSDDDCKRDFSPTEVPCDLGNSRC